MEFQAGDRVRFFRTHDKTTLLEGVVKEVSDDLLRIEAAPDGKNVEVPALMDAHPNDAELIREEDADGGENTDV